MNTNTFIFVMSLCGVFIAGGLDSAWAQTTAPVDPAPKDVSSTGAAGSDKTATSNSKVVGPPLVIAERNEQLLSVAPTFWSQPEEEVRAKLDGWLKPAKARGVTTVFVAATMPSRWVNELGSRLGLRVIVVIDAGLEAKVRTSLVNGLRGDKAVLSWVVASSEAPSDEPSESAEPSGASSATSVNNAASVAIAAIAALDPGRIVGFALPAKTSAARAKVLVAAVPNAAFIVTGSTGMSVAVVVAAAKSEWKKGVLLGVSDRLGSDATVADRTRRWISAWAEVMLQTASHPSLVMGGWAAPVSQVDTASVSKALIFRTRPEQGAFDALKKHAEGVLASVNAPVAAGADAVSAKAPKPTAKTPEKKPGVKKGKAHQVTVYRDKRGFRLKVDGKDFFVKGMNWGYMPIGENYSYDFWGKSDAFIRKALDTEMTLLKKMGVNAIRQYDVIPPRWVTYIHKKYGIYTMINHLVGRYGFHVDGVWQSPINYESPKTRAAIKASVIKTIERYKNTPGVLLWLLGNENNYGLHWASSEIEDLPVGKADVARAKFLYSLMGELVDIIHKRDKLHPVSICNGDVQYIDVMKKHASNLDIFGTNVYRGKSVRDMFEVVNDKLGVPVMFTEFGSDAYNAKEDREDHLAQAEYLKAQWKEIYEESHGKGGEGNALGGFVFQWSDGWWKYRQEENLDVHDTNASWSTGAYRFDYMPGDNNMNEEWFGICAKGKSDENGHYPVYPRSAYYVLRDIFELDAYETGVDKAAIAKHFAPIDPYEHDARYQRDAAGEQVRLLERIRLANLGMKFETFTTGGDGVSDPLYGKNPRFDHLESFFVGLEVQPVRRFTGSLSLNILGNVPENPINEIFYEDRGKRRSFTDVDGKSVAFSDIERLAVYGAKFNWDEKWFNLSSYYRTGHYHWMDEGDFFNFYREAYYGPWIDTYNADAPFGMVFSGKKALRGLKIAAGPEVFWGANPTVIAKYRRNFGKWAVTAMHQEDVAGSTRITTSARIPEPQSRKTMVGVKFGKGRYTVETGGLVAGTRRIGREFSAAREAAGLSYLNSGYHIVEDEIRPIDTLGGKVKVTADWSPVKMYVQGAYKGLVADAGPDQMPNMTGWTLRESGRGNQFNVLGGVLVQVADFQIAPNFMYQRPLEGPLPNIGDFISDTTGVYYPGVTPRNIQDHPFAVLENRETIGLEMLLAYDPTPATYMWMWDNNKREDAPFAASVDFVYRIQPTGRDAAIGFSADGQPQVLGAVGARDVWEVKSRIVSNLPNEWRILANLYGGQSQANSGGSPVLDRVIDRVGGDIRVGHRKLLMAAAVQVNDWGPYDYHRDYNITYPLQLHSDVSYAFKFTDWLNDFYSRVGANYRIRFLDEYSVPLVVDTGKNGYIYEVRTYLHVTL